jgi:hypothetical protein
MTSGVGEGVAVDGTTVGVEITAGSTVSVGAAVGLGAGVSVGMDEARAVKVGSDVLVAGISNVGSGLAVGSNSDRLQAPKTSTMSSSATPIFAIDIPLNLISLPFLASVLELSSIVSPSYVPMLCKRVVRRMLL